MKRRRKKTSFDCDLSEVTCGLWLKILIEHWRETRLTHRKAERERERERASQLANKQAREMSRIYNAFVCCVWCVLYVDNSRPLGHLMAVSVAVNEVYVRVTTFVCLWFCLRACIRNECRHFSKWKKPVFPSCRGVHVGLGGMHIHGSVLSHPRSRYDILLLFITLVMLAFTVSFDVVSILFSVKCF